MVATFRFNATRVFLTYSQVSDTFTKETVFYGIDERWPLKKYIIAEENHQEGGRHIHAVLEFTVKINVTDPRGFDIGDGEQDFHPNIQSIRRGQANWDRLADYCTKEDPNPLSNVDPKLTWGEIFNHASCKEEYLTLVKKHYPREYALQLKNLEYSANALFPQQDQNTIHQYEWTANFSPDAWDRIDEEVLTWDNTATSLVLVGPAGCGKTTWAKLNAPKPALWIRHLDSLNLLRPEHRSIIIDDMTLHHLPENTQKYLVDTRDLAEIHTRYRVARLPPGLVRIYTSNEFPFTTTGIHADAIRRRVHTIDLY